MNTHRSFRRTIGTVIYDWPRFVFCLLARGGWRHMRNRNDPVTLSDQGNGVRCDWEYTRSLHLCDMFPVTGRWLLRRALETDSIRMRTEPENVSPGGVCWNGDDVHACGTAPQVSFLIGHRGGERLPLLRMVLQSIAAQRGCLFECIVVEQGEFAQIKDALPSWVRYCHQPVKADVAYNRSATFNQAARMARSPLLICHDNDMLIPMHYSRDIVSLYRQGYDVINLKRFVFYLGQECIFDDQSLTEKCHFVIESVMQNTTGGGSLAVCRKAFESIGGFDENFVGWGGEDVEFWSRCRTLKCWDFTNQPLIHLWHPPQPGKRAVRGLGVLTAELTERRMAIPPQQRIQELCQRNRGAGRREGQLSV